MFFALAILLCIAALMAVAYPILARTATRRSVASSAQETLEELVAQRDALFQALRDLTFDHQVGKVTDEDFVMFEANLKQGAADTLRALDEWESGLDRDLEQVLEAEIASRRTATRGPSGGRICPACGARASIEDKFCAVCGAALPAPTPGAPSAAESTCPHCNRPITEDDRFCAGCGQPVAQSA